MGAGLAVLGAADFGCELSPQEERTSKSAAPTTATARTIFVVLDTAATMPRKVSLASLGSALLVCNKGRDV